ncbi:cellulose biosynthesis protein BcsF [Pseudomonas syringae]|nr:cellulose biosynthesis protein BcsF [Pseudomonas syringae]MBD8577329.1 cellulose biosynthesis protein BcsF [Pseudomonas syringae]MBD8793153.1 cellulose biosynthesis protein BcsF [Pseudomonas syringae]MBD8802874.1 cellulose biosynthesis protein BcsF [Pseudomonas syringae]MBD8813586.1 cellulose biosynthesis protein BcsF [Pseudomonas syringae]
MSYPQLLQVMAVSVLLTVALILLLRSVRHRLARWWQTCLPPRHLKPRGVRRRAPADAAGGDTHERP